MYSTLRRSAPIRAAALALAIAAAGAPLPGQEPQPQLEPLTTASLLGAVAPDPALSRVVARVNGEDITESERTMTARKMMMQYLQRLGPAAENLPPGQIDLLREEMSKNAVEQTINMKLIEQERAKVKVPDEEIDKQIKIYEEQIKEQGGSLEQVLAQQGMTEPDLRKNIVTRLQVEMILEKRAGGELDPTEEEMQKLYEENKDQMMQPPQVRASHVLIGFPGSPRDPGFAPPSDEVKLELRKKAEEVLAKAKAGEDFAKLADQYSTDPTVNVNHGDLGMNPRGRMVKPFDDAQWSLEVGEISDIVETQFGFHIIKVTGKQGDKVMTFEDMKEPIRQEVVRRKMETGMRDLIADLRKNANIEYLEKPAGTSTTTQTTQTTTMRQSETKAETVIESGKGTPKAKSKAE